MLPIFHIIGNVTKAPTGSIKLEPINDCSGVTYYEGIYHAWHQCCKFECPPRPAALVFCSPRPAARACVAAAPALIVITQPRAPPPPRPSPPPVCFR